MLDLHGSWIRKPFKLYFSAIEQKKGDYCKKKAIKICTSPGEIVSNDLCNTLKI